MFRCGLRPIATACLLVIVPNLMQPGPFAVQTVSAERTFWEKAMLVHEESYRPIDKPHKARLARHYYDLWRLITHGVAARALADRLLFDRVAAHRAIFFRWSWMDYATLRPGSLRLVPPADQLVAWRNDYRDMKKEMFFGEVCKRRSKSVAGSRA